MSSESVWGGIHIIGWVFPALLLLLVVVTMRAGHGKIPPNSLIGIRLPSVRRSAAAWQAGHKAAVPAAWVGFLGALGCAVVGLIIPFAYFGSVAFFLACVVWAFVAAAAAAAAGE